MFVFSIVFVHLQNCSYEAQSAEELSCLEGQEFGVISEEDGWYKSNIDGAIGFVPSTYCEKL